MKRNIITTATAVSIASGLCFAEKSEVTKLKDLSLRVSLGNAPGIEDFEDSRGFDNHVKDADYGSRIEILAVKRWWGESNQNIGGSIGGGIFVGRHTLSETGTISGDLNVDLTIFGGIIQGGFIAKAGKNFVFEVGPYLGLGIAYNETTGYTDSTGSYGLFGIKGGAFILPSENIEIGLELGYEGFEHKQDYKDGFGGTVDVTFSGSGPRVAAVFVVKF